MSGTAAGREGYAGATGYNTLGPDGDRFQDRDVLDQLSLVSATLLCWVCRVCWVCWAGTP